MSDKINLKFWQEWNKQLEAMDADKNLDFISQYPISQAVTANIEANTAMVKERVDIISNNCKMYGDKIPSKILEFGGGWGNFCKIYTEQINKSEFTIIDNPGMIKFAKVFLEKYNINANFIPAESSFDIEGNFDIFVAFSSISEVEPSHRSKILEHYLPRVKSVLIGETKEEMDSWVTDTISKHFKYIHVHKTAHQRAHYLIYGSNKSIGK